jgi:hypothetical protein
LRRFLQETPTLEHLLLSALDNSSLRAIASDLITPSLCQGLHDLKFKDADVSTIAALSACLPLAVGSPSTHVIVAANFTDRDDPTHQLIHALRLSGINIEVTV